MAYVGDIYIQAVSDLDSKSGDRDPNEINGINMVSTIGPPKSDKIDNFKMAGSVFDEYEGKDEDGYAEDIHAIKERTGAYNYIRYADTNGFVEVTSLDVPKSAGEAHKRSYSISGKYLPSSQYERTYVMNTEKTLALGNNRMITQGIPPVVSLPIGAKNVKIKGPYQILNITEPSFYLDSPDGRVPIYQPFPVMSPHNGSINYDWSFSSGVKFDYNNKYYGMSCAILPAATTDNLNKLLTFYVYVGIAIPRGTYKLVWKMKYVSKNSIVDAKKKVRAIVYGYTSDGQSRTLMDSEYFTPTTEWALYESSADINATDFDEKLQIGLQSENFVGDVYIEYAYLVPTYSARVSYEVDTEFDAGEVQVYDVVDGIYNRVYSKNHIFEGQLLIRNAFNGWMLDPTKKWSDTGYLVDAQNSRTVLKLYPYAFKDDKPKFMIISILPDEVKFQIACDVGTTRNCKMVTTISALAYGFTFDVHKINQFKNDWVMISDEQDSDFNYYNDLFTVKDSTGLNNISVANDVSFCYFKYGMSLYQLTKNTEYNFTVDNRGIVYINGAIENDYDYKFMLTTIPLNTPATCYSDNIYAAAQNVGGLRSQPFKYIDTIKFDTDIKKSFLSYYPENLSTFDNGRIKMTQSNNNTTLLMLKNYKYNDCVITVKGKILL